MHFTVVRIASAPPSGGIFFRNPVRRQACGDQSVHEYGPPGGGRFNSERTIGSINDCKSASSGGYILCITSYPARLAAYGVTEKSATVRKRWRNSFYRKMHIYIYCSTYKYIMSLLCSEDFLHFGSRGGLEIYGLFRDGVDELYAASQKRDAAVGITAARTVLQVALYRCSGKG